jgi:hypothetical protein
VSLLGLDGLGLLGVEELDPALEDLSLEDELELGLDGALDGLVLEPEDDMEPDGEDDGVLLEDGPLDERVAPGPPALSQP